MKSSLMHGHAPFEARASGSTPAESQPYLRAATLFSLLQSSSLLDPSTIPHAGQWVPALPMYAPRHKTFARACRSLLWPDLTATVEEYIWTCQHSDTLKPTIFHQQVSSFLCHQCPPLP